ncbi:hypothetical protein VNO80_03435 [Phaseolus coccineus]|uniref:Uncharacterized protein n=1 Tax=Phaseolus coccineus TaxID=3886 RepID=A0AAN9NRF3_PHACN
MKQKTTWFVGDREESWDAFSDEFAGETIELHPAILFLRDSDVGGDDGGSGVREVCFVIIYKHYDISTNYQTLPYPNAEHIYNFTK